MTSRLRGLLLSVSAIACVSAGAAHAAADDVLASVRAAKVTDKAALASAKRATPEATLAAHLRGAGKSDATIGTLVKTADFVAADGKRFARFEQRINGLKVHGAFARVAFDADGAPMQVMDRLAVAGGNIAKATLGADEAISIAANANHGPASADPDFFHRAPSAEPIIVARGNGRLEEGFLVVTWSRSDNQLYHTVIDAFGRVVDTEHRTNTDSYRVYTNSPEDSPTPVIVNGPGSTTESPNGWLNPGSHRSIRIQGNNVDAYLDRDDSESPDAGGVTITDGNFVAVANLAADPETAVNQDAAVQNLFYLNNRIHDILYRAGFTEATGNFQTDNFGRGGAGNDPVNAEAQDGQGTDNANFATPGDGARPRMQMYIWTRSTPRRDGDLDSDIVFHEYGHGLTWRMIGSMGGNVSGAIGEGMSDTLAFVINDEPTLAEYSYNRAAGLRSVSADLQNETVGDFNSRRGVHRNGEIFGATMWDAWTLYKAAGHNADTALADWVGGMNFINPDPTFIDMRDGFLANAPADRDCLIWNAFAEHGMGVGATMDSRRGNATESFTVPSECDGVEPPPPPTVTAELTGITAIGTAVSNRAWESTATFTVQDGGQPASGITVLVEVTGLNGSCVTNGSGVCGLTLTGLGKGDKSVTWTVISLDGDTNATGVGSTATAQSPL